MGNYENGTSTRKLILNACHHLFLEKGFHETSYDDICRKAHVNRGSIYYHFKEKENIRYEILWNLVIQNRNFILQHFPETEHELLLSLYLLWKQFFENPMIRKFILDYFNDQPIYDSSSELGRFYRTLYTRMFEKLWPFEKIDRLSFAAFYGHLYGLFCLADANLSSYTPEVFFRHCLYASATLWNVPHEKADSLCRNLIPEMRTLVEINDAPYAKAGVTPPLLYATP